MIVAGSLTGKWDKYGPALVTILDGEMLIQTLLVEEMRIDGSKPIVASRETAMRANQPRGRVGGRQLVCEHCSMRGHSKEKCWAPGGDGEKTAPNWYKPPAHMVKSNSGQSANTSLESSAATAGGSNTTESANLAAQPTRHVAMYASLGTEGGDTSWILDSGASSHMTNNRLLFRTYKEFGTPEVVNGAQEGSVFLAEGRGTIEAKLILRGKITTTTLHHVLYTPELAHNLLSVSKLAAVGIDSLFRGEKCFFSDSNGQFGYAERDGNLYHVRITVTSEASFIATTAGDRRKDLCTWHRRLGHVSENQIRKMVKHHAVDGIELIGPEPTGQCEACIFGKHAATPSPERTERAKNPFDVIHSDIKYMIDESFSGAKYSLKFSDECSGYTWQYCVNSKDGETVLDAFKNLDTHIETRFGKCVKGFHSDNGCEYVNSEMNDYLKIRGIQHFTIAPHRHEVNGIIERGHRTGSDSVRSVLADAKLPKAYWAEAYSYSTYVRNRTGRSFLNPDKTPYEMIYGSKPDISHIRVFGCTAYVKIPAAQRKKLDPKSVKGVFVGIFDDAAYRIMIPSSRETLKSKDVIFEEGRGTRTTDPVVDPDSQTFDRCHVDGPNKSESVVAKPRTAVPITIPLAQRRARRGDHTTARRKEGLEQEETLRHLDSLGLPDDGKTDRDFAGFSYQRRYIAGVLIPLTMREALSSEHANEWQEAGTYELGTLLQHNVWDEVPRPANAHVICGKWVFNIKEDPDGALSYRARWVARGDFQLESKFDELHASSGDFNVAKIVHALAASEDGELITADIQSAYLHSKINRDQPIYVEYPHGFHPIASGDIVCLLNRAIYGLRQGARAWEDQLTLTMGKSGYIYLVTAPSTFYRRDAEGESIIGVHVDDMTSACFTATGAKRSEGERFQNDIAKDYQFTKKDLSKKAKVLGWTVEVNKDEGWIKISVEQKIANMLDKYQMLDSNSVLTPMTVDLLSAFDQDKSDGFERPPFPYANLVGELLWLLTNARPDIAFSVQVLARFLQRPKEIHWTAAKRVLRYLKGTMDLSLCYRPTGPTTVVGHSDSDWARDPQTRKSMSGCIFTLGGSPVVWKAKFQRAVAFSTAKAEYLAVSMCAREAVWFRHFLSEIGRDLGDKPLEIFVDNEAAIRMTENPVYHSRTKHIDIPAPHIRDKVKRGSISVTHIAGTENPADILTKPLAAPAHKRCLELMGMV